MNKIETKIINLRNFLDKNSHKLLWLFIFVYIIIFSFICLFKFKIFSYNAIDLSIYNQVFYNTSLGKLFQFTIHPHSYLGDHFEPFIFILVPIYFLFKSPFALLVIQTFFIGLSAIPIYLIAREKINNLWALFFALIFLLCPFVQNANLFEFHLLTISIFFLLFTFYFYQKRYFKHYILFLLLSILIREDVALVIFMFGILALIDKRKLKWILIPIIISIIWFVLSLQIISHFNPEQNYKYLIYYNWLGTNPLEILKNTFIHPLLIINHLFTFSNLFLVMGFLIPFCGLPIFKLKYLIPSALIFLQLLLSGFSELVFKTHYNVLITPFLFISSIFAINYLLKSPKQSKLKLLILKQKTIFIVIFIIAVIYSTATLGPIFPSFWEMIKYTYNQESIQLKEYFLADTSKNLPVASSFAFLPNLSNRTNLYSLHYAFLGKKQYSDKDYVLPDDTQEILVEANDFLIYQMQSQNIPVYKEQYQTGDDRLRDIITKKEFGIAKVVDDLILFKKNIKNNIRLYDISSLPDPALEQFNKELNNEIKFIGWRKTLINSDINQIKGKEYQILPIALSWQALKKIDNNYQLMFELLNEKGEPVYRKIYPLAYGLYPASKWKMDEIVTTNYWLLIPHQFPLKNYNVSFSLVSPKGYMGLNGLSSVEIKYQNIKIIGESLK